MDIKQKIQNYAAEVDNEKQRQMKQDLAITQTQAIVEAVIKSIAFQIDDEKENPRHVVVDNTLEETRVSNLGEVSETIKEGNSVINDTLDGLRVSAEVQANVLSQLLECLKCLPTEYPEVPEMPEELKITNFPDHKEYFDAVIKAIQDKQLNPVFDPKITVKASDVNIEYNHTPVLEALQALETAIMVSTPSFDIKPLVDAQKATEQAVRDIVIPKPPNFISSFRDSAGKSTSVELKTDGSIPVTIISGGSSYSKPTDEYDLIQDDDTSSASYEYYGFMKADGGWYIKRVTLATNLREYVKGTSGYTTAWTGRAGQSYADYGVTF